MNLVYKIIKISNLTKNERMQIRLKLKSHIVDNYSVNNTIDRYQTLYDDILRGGC